jgi:hypothetical protein
MRVGRMLPILSVALLVAPAFGADAQAAPGGHPNFSGFWDLSVRIPRDKTLMDELPSGTVVLDDTGPVEYPRGEYGGLKIKPKALAAAKAWNPADDLTISNACKPPSIIYAMQGPFPMEIYQGTELIVFKLEYYDMVRIIFMDGRKVPENAPHTKTGYSVGHWEGSTLVVETTHLEAATITNNGLGHSDRVRVIERFRLGADGQTLLSTQQFDDPEVLDGTGARFIAWRRKAGEFVNPYDCDPSFAEHYGHEGDALGAPPAQQK